MNPTLRPASLAVFLVSTLALTGCSADSGGAAAASCMAPQLRVSSGEIVPGSHVVIEGRYFHACYDTGQEAEPPPKENVRLTIRQQGTAYGLGSVDARPGGRATWTVTLPQQLEAGTARLSTQISETLEVEVQQTEAAEASDEGGEDQLGGDIGTVTSGAACAAPQILLGGREVRPGESITVRGRYFFDGCNDTGGQGERSRPEEGVGIDLVQGDRSWPLGSADADSRGRVGWTVALPEDLEPGPAGLGSRASETIEIEVVAG